MLTKKPKKGDILLYDDGEHKRQYEVTGWFRNSGNIACLKDLETQCTSYIIVHFPNKNEFNKYLTIKQKEKE